jgi:prolipoprotein diacylglyceryl transferase
LSFQWYGLLVGLGVVATLLLVEARIALSSLAASERTRRREQLWTVAPLILACAVIGARLWHVATDIELYLGNWSAVIAVWQGGLSIFGAVLGAVLGLWLAVRMGWLDQSLPWWLDLLPFGVAVGQAIGRLGNWVNNELYGLPSELPWAIEIPVEARVAGYEEVARYHPLFAYEMIFLALLAGLIWLWHWRRGTDRWLGTGRIFAGYVGAYAVWRLLLDGLRLERSMLTPWLGDNQAVLLLVLAGLGVCCWKKYYKKDSHAT